VPALPGLEGATLVVAESLEAASAAIAGGVPRRRVWALALPADRLVAEGTGYGAEVARAAETLGGLLTDSEPARESLERAASSSRPRVEIFPPVAGDRPCPGHPAADPATIVGDGPGASPGGLPPAVAQLSLWRRMTDDGTAGGAGEPRYSFAAARLRGFPARWAGWEPAWRTGAGAPAPAEATGPTGWSARAQDLAARRLWDAAEPRRPSAPRPARAALVAGFDLKFATDLAERLDHRTDLTVTVDDWRTLSEGTPRTESRLRDAGSIFAEWARTSAVWYSRRKRPDQFLAVRLHRFELDAPYPREIEIDNVDAVVYIAPLFGRRIRDELGWPAEKLIYIPNYLDLDWLDRPKLPEARFTLGLVGVEFRRKRFDLALDFLSALRREDPRYTLLVRSTMPWQNRYAWSDPDEREYVAGCWERIGSDPSLRHAVVFDQPGRDMAAWFRRVGHVLSTSDEEGCHTAVAEGMASGAVPVVRPWPGADEIYDKQWIHAGVEEAAEAVLECADERVWTERGARARAEIRRTYDPVAVVDAWADLLHGDLARARGHFVAYAGMDAGEAPAG
jgi:glycosyltransferase involved in cell wall biosynthesis